jgi:hypothetical protein
MQAKFLQQTALKSFKLTPNAENRFRLGCGSPLCLLRKTSDLGRGGFFGLIITRVSSLMSSSKSLLSDETDSCLCTGPCSPDQSTDDEEMKIRFKTMCNVLSNTVNVSNCNSQTCGSHKKLLLLHFFILPEVHMWATCLWFWMKSERLHSNAISHFLFSLWPLNLWILKFYCQLHKYFWIPFNPKNQAAMTSNEPTTCFVNSPTVRLSLTSSD